MIEYRLFYVFFPAIVRSITKTTIIYHTNQCISTYSLDLQFFNFFHYEIKMYHSFSAQSLRIKQSNNSNSTSSSSQRNQKDLILKKLKTICNSLITPSPLEEKKCNFKLSSAKKRWKDKIYRKKR